MSTIQFFSRLQIRGNTEMDNARIGQLIQQLRKEKGFTQQQLADSLNVSNKTVSKWECGNGAPDISIWNSLSNVLGADLMHFAGEDPCQNSKSTGKISRLMFFICPECGQIFTSTGKAGITCCGRKLSALVPSSFDDCHAVKMEIMDGEFFVTVSHEMSKSHYISFAAYVDDDSCWFKKLYPEQNPEFRMPMFGKSGTFFLYCTEHGLFSEKLRTLLAQ